MKSKGIAGWQVFEGLVKKLKEKGCVERIREINIYRCLESWSDVNESGRSGITFKAFYLIKVPETKKTFALLKGDGSASGRGSTDIRIDVRLIDVTDIRALCEKWNTSQEGMVDTIITMLTHKIRLMSEGEQDWHFGRDYGLLMRIRRDDTIWYAKEKVSRFILKSGWSPRIIDHLADKFIEKILAEKS